MPSQRFFQAKIAAVRDFFENLSLATRLLWGMAVVIGVFTALSVAWDIHDIRREAEKEMLQRARVVARELVALRFVIARNQDKINTDPATGNIRFKHLNPASVGRQVAEVFNETTQFSLKQTRLEVRNPANAPDPGEVKMLKQLASSPRLPEIWQEEYLPEGWYFRYMIPLETEESCLACHGEPAGEKDIAGYPREGLRLGEPAGAISLKLPMDSYREALRTRIWGRIIFAASFVMITWLISTWLAKRMVARPLQNLTGMARRLGEEDWEAIRPVAGTGEIRVLSRTFEKVARQLKESHDILEEKVRERTRQLVEANEKLDRANRFKSDVLANVSHELKTPLTAIIALTEMLLNPATGPLNKEQREYLEDIADSSRQLALEVSDLLQMARLEAGKLELHPEPVNLAGVVNECFDQLAPLAKKKGIRFILPPGTEEWWVLADRAKVRHILNNLVSNAVKFTPGGGRVEITLERKSGGRNSIIQNKPGNNFDRLVVGVIDNGAGIAPENQGVVFEKFRQLGRAGHGAGLGLALAKELVQLHGGEIWVESEPGRGSAFYFSLPLEERML